jgi:hypothetical protein
MLRPWAWEISVGIEKGLLGRVERAGQETAREPVQTLRDRPR